MGGRPNPKSGRLRAISWLEGRTGHNRGAGSNGHAGAGRDTFARAGIELAPVALGDLYFGSPKAGRSCTHLHHPIRRPPGWFRFRWRGPGRGDRGSPSRGAEAAIDGDPVALGGDQGDVPHRWCIGVGMIVQLAGSRIVAVLHAVAEGSMSGAAAPAVGGIDQ